MPLDGGQTTHSTILPVSLTALRLLRVSARAQAECDQAPPLPAPLCQCIQGGPNMLSVVLPTTVALTYLPRLSLSTRSPRGCRPVSGNQWHSPGSAAEASRRWKALVLPGRKSMQQKPAVSSYLSSMAPVFSHLGKYLCKSRYRFHQFLSAVLLKPSKLQIAHRQQFLGLYTDFPRAL